jgi:hypothetical protein
MNMVRIIFLFLFFTGLGANGRVSKACLGAKFSAPSVVSSPVGSMILVTHPSGEFDFSHSAAVGIDRLVKFAKESGMTSVYLQNSNLSDVYAFDCDPDYWVSSQQRRRAHTIIPLSQGFGKRWE